MMQICRDLDAAGIRSVHGKTMTINSLRRILTNRAYIGEYSYSGHVIPDGMPRIIDDDLFAKVQARLEANKRGGKGARVRSTRRQTLPTIGCPAIYTAACAARRCRLSVVLVSLALSITITVARATGSTSAPPATDQRM